MDRGKGPEDLGCYGGSEDPMEGQEIICLFYIPSLHNIFVHIHDCILYIAKLLIKRNIYLLLF